MQVPRHLSRRINYLQREATWSAVTQQLRIRFGEHPSSFKVPGDFRKAIQN